MKIFKLKHPLWLFIFILILNSCTHLLHLEKAQNAFNKGAELENAAKLDFSNVETSSQVVNQALSSTSPNSYYKLAYAEINKALGSKGKLKSDDVLGTVYALKALCEWKLNQHTQAVTTSRDALDELERAKIRSPRDEAVMAALPGLVNSDIAYDSMEVLQAFLIAQMDIENPSAESFLSNYKRAQNHYQKFIFDATDAQGKIESALVKIGQAAKRVSLQHEVQRYFALAQMAGLKTWADELSEITNFATKVQNLNPSEKQNINTWLDMAYKNFFDTRDTHLKNLAVVLPGNTNNALYKRWQGLLNISR